MKITIPVTLSDLKEAGGVLFAVVIVDQRGEAICADGIVTDAQLAMNVDIFADTIGHQGVIAALEQYRNTPAQTLVLTH